LRRISEAAGTVEANAKLLTKERRGAADLAGLPEIAALKFDVRFRGQSGHCSAAP